MANEKQTIRWTHAQQAAIETTGRDVLVTASAGTGKTAVLSARVVERICDADDPAQADSLLVLTFTEAAAEEMRSRIAETLRARYAADRSEALRRQLLLLDRAYISTIHAFCKRILTEFFYLLDLDPTFGILDADEQRLLKSELLDKTLQQAWEDESLAGGLEVLFAGRRIQPGTNSFVDQIIPLSEFLDSVVSRGVFYERAAALNDHLHEACGELHALQKELLLDKLARCQAQLDYALQLDAAHCGGQYATDFIQQQYLPMLECCRGLLEKDRFDLCAQHVNGFDFGRMPAFKKARWDEACKDLIKGPIDAVKTTLKTFADFALLCSDYETVLAPQVSGQTRVLLNLLARFDANYTAAKNARHVLDFADLEHGMLRLLDSQPEIAHKLRRRFDYLFVDEYQDINAVQQRLIEQLSRDDNVFVVGDIKQSIYGFRQSKPNIFLKRLQTAADITVSQERGQEPLIAATEKRCLTPLISEEPLISGRVDLQENFRCRGEVIDFVNTLFGRVMTTAVADMDYDAKATLVSGYPYPPFKALNGPPHPVEFYLLDEDSRDDDTPETADETETTESISAPQRQAAFVARRIQQIVGAETGTPEFDIYDKKAGTFRPAEYRDIVILMRSLSHKAQDYVEMLRLAGVPVSSQSACGYFEATEISDCLCLLKVLDNADRDIELAALLRSPIFGLDDSALAAIRLAGDKDSSFYQAILAYADNGPEPSLRTSLQDILAELNAWRRQVHQGSLADLLDTVFRTKRLLSFYSALPNGAQRRANLLKLHDHAIGFEHFRTTEPGAALGRFVEFLEKLTETEQDWAPAEPDSSTENAVRIMSVHKSKGLEFPVVFLAELNTPFNRRSQSGQCLIDDQTVGLEIIDRNAAGRFSSLAHQVIAERRKKADRAEEMRILYVALTRAREKLILTAGRRENACVNLLTECNVVPASCRQLEQTESKTKTETLSQKRSLSENRERPAGSRRYGAADWKLTEANCHLDWLLMGLGKNAALCGLFDVSGSEPDGLFFAGRIGRDELDRLTDTIRRQKRELTSHTTPPPPNTPAAAQAGEAFDAIQSNLLWRYPFAELTEVSAKLSVSEWTHRDDEFSKTDLTRAFARKPAAVAASTTPSKTADALSLGSAVHAVLEHIDLSQPVDAAAIEKTINKLIENGLLDQSLAGQINTAAILSFFDSDLGQLAQQAGTVVLREWPFTYALDAALTKRGLTPLVSDARTKRCQEPLITDEIVVLQGIVDMIIPTAEGLVIVDFKTDRVNEETIAERADRYTEQLRLYARAAGDILRQPVAGAWLYFLAPQKAVEVK